MSDHPLVLLRTFITGLKMIPLEEMGNRICVLGCSNSGKSTLSEALSKKLTIPVHHLDQYAHIENSNWQRQSDEVLIKKHTEIIREGAWIIDGNYSVCMNDRLDRATFVIWLDPSVFSSIFRYFTRSIKNNPNRPGRLAGARKEFSLWLIKWIVFNYPKNREKYQRLLDSKPKLQVLRIRSMRILKKYYRYWSIFDI
jgi:adenylate kinase family enzyme